MYYRITNQPMGGTYAYSGVSNTPAEERIGNIDMTVRGKGNDKKPKKTYSFRLGERQGNTRIVDQASVSIEISSIMFAKLNGIASNRPNIIDNFAHPSGNDGVIGASRQGKRGDCFFLAEINAIRNTAGGQKILNSNIKRNNGTITITLPGAVKIRQEYAKKGLKCEVTGTYTITKEAIAKAEKLAGKSFSKDDMDVVCYEIAMECFRAEMVKTNKLNGNKENSGNFTVEGAVSHLASRDYMDGGFTYDAGFILTGEKSDVYVNGKKYKNAQRYSDGQYGYITKEQMLKQTTFAHAGAHAKGISEINHLGKEEQDLYNMLDKYKGHENEYALTCSVRVSKDGPDGTTKEDGAHAITIVKITDDTVYVSNPWHPDKIEPIPRKEFVKMAYSMSAMHVPKPQTSQNGHNSTQILNLVMGKLSSAHSDIRPPAKINPNKLNNLLSGVNSSSQGNRPNVNINSFIQIMNHATTSQLSNNDKVRLNRLLNGLSAENTKGEANIEDFNYFYAKYMK